jgi:RNA polymerase sigma-70 factor (ECF subfamily)
VPHETPLPNRTATGAELIARAQQGDEAAFEAIYKAHHKRVYHLCLRMTTNVAEAEDLTQETFLQVFRKIHTFRGDSAFSTWLHRLAVNVVLMRLRRKKPVEISVENAAQNDNSESQPWEFAVPDLVLSGVIDRLALERAVAELPAGYREVFLMHDVLGYEHHEIAEAQGYTVGNSKSQLHKARMKLRQYFRPARLAEKSRTDTASDLQLEVAAADFEQEEQMIGSPA